jgi:dihydroorotase
VKVGVPGLETTLPLILTLVKKNKLSFGRAVQLLAETPAEVFGLKGGGRLEEGVFANFQIKSKILPI